ncbi:MAG TPA: hypothetical protein VFH73_11350 [Polyangia bacterium]|jgi:hypothetical protein|nr:hypothetical protein [Polyangia bacterium]
MMTRTMAAVLELVVLPMFALGCGKVSGKPGGIRAEDAPTEIARAVCPKAYVCCKAAELMGNELAGTDEPSCETKTAEAFRNQLQPVLASEARFRSDYDGVKLEACLAHVRAATCSELGTTNHFSGIPGCDAFVAPRLGVGEACGHDWECTDGWCEGPTLAADGVCRPLAKDGESCETAKCDKGILCDSATKLCARPRAEGEVCLRADQCASNNCPAAAMAGADRTCGAAKGGACFYSAACSAAGAGRPGLLSLALMLAIAAVAAVRRVAGTATPRRRSRAARTR